MHRISSDSTDFYDNTDEVRERERERIHTIRSTSVRLVIQIDFFFLWSNVPCGYT